MLSRFSYKTQRKIIIISFLSFPLILLITFSYLPMGSLFYYSLTKWNGISINKEFVGLYQYKKILSHPQYFEVFKVSLYYLVGTFIQMTLALYFATLLSFKTIGKNFFKATIFFPNLLNSVAIGFIFLVFFKPDGTLDSVLKLLHLEEYIQYWLRDTRFNNICLVFTSIWRYMGFNFIVFLGAIQSISSDIYEAADIDGANKWHKFKYIIFPSIKNIIELNLILSVSGAIRVFEIPYIMTQGGNGTKTFVIQVIQTAFSAGSRRVGLASAMAVILFIILVIVTLIQRLLFRDKEEGRLL